MFPFIFTLFRVYIVFLLVFLGPECEIEEKLEDQFKQGIEHKLLGPKNHIGLGFHEDPKKISENSRESTKDEKGNDETTDDKVAEKHKLDEKTDSDIPVKKKMMYNFVKASDS